MENKINVKLILILLSLTIVIGLSIAFASLSKRLKVEGEATADPANWDIHFVNLSEPEIKGNASIVEEPNISEKGVSIDNIKVNLTLPGDSVTYTVDIENSGDINSEISLIEPPTLTSTQSELFEFKVYYTDTNEELKVGDELEPGYVKNVTIKIKYKDIEDPNLLPKTTQTINLSYKVTYVQSNKSFYTESGLPKTYTELEYLESTGTQYIDTNIISSNTLKISLIIQINDDLNSKNFAFLGAYNTKVNSFNILCTNANISGWILQWGREYKIIGTKDNNRHYHVIDLLNKKYILDDTTYDLSINYKNNLYNSLYLFGANEINDNRMFTKMKLWNFKLYDNGALLLNFVPALDPQGRPCMYDTVTKQPFYNQGTGEFLYPTK